PPVAYFRTLIHDLGRSRVCRAHVPDPPRSAHGAGTMAASSASVPEPAPTPVPSLVSAIAELDVLWITAGLSCDGDTIAMTAASQPSIEELVLGAIPGLPKVNLHNPVLAYKNGDDFLEAFHRAAEGLLEPFLLVVEGSIPNEANKAEGCWAGFG